MFTKKFRKLLRNPKLFLFDALKNKLPAEEIRKSLGSNFNIDPSGTQAINHKPESKPTAVKPFLKQDWIHSKKNLIPSLIKYLMERTCFIQPIETPNSDSIRIAIKSDDFENVTNHIKNFISDDGLWIELDRESFDKPQRSIINAYFRDETTIYRSPCIELDPWFLSEKYKRVYSHNYNYVCTHLDIHHLNKTVHASNPYFLQGDIQPTENYHLSSMLNLSPSVYEHFDFDVDIVYTWVDGNDKRWQQKKNNYDSNSSNNEDTDVARYEQIDELRYSLRSIASYFKDFRKIFIITDGQIPWWLDTSNEHVTIIDHKDIFPDISHLPVFNSHAIEANLHRIPGLSKKFIYLNDDIFLWNSMGKDKFFKANGLSISRFEKIANVHGQPSHHFPAWKNAAINNNWLLAKKYNLQSYSYHLHCPHSLDKEVCQKMWEEFGEELNKTSQSKFRSITDISPISFLYHAYSFINKHSVKDDNWSTNVEIFNTANSEHINKLERIIHDSKIDFVCINDGGKERYTEKVIKILETKFPIKAEWELVD